MAAHNHTNKRSNQNFQKVITVALKTNFNLVCFYVMLHIVYLDGFVDGGMVATNNLESNYFFDGNQFMQRRHLQKNKKSKISQKYENNKYVISEDDYNGWLIKTSILFALILVFWISWGLIMLR